MLPKKVIINIFLFLNVIFFFFAGTLISQATDGVCGNFNTSGLCATGTVSNFNGTGPWTWTCNQFNGGSDVSCSGGNNNPSGYVSLHGDFGEAVPDKDGYAQMPGVIVSGYLQKFRVFIPPGATQIYLNIYEYGNRIAVTKHKIPPTTFNIPLNYSSPQLRTLDQLIQNDQMITGTKGEISIIDDSYAPNNCISLTKSGWLYVYVTNASSSHYNHSFIIGVNAEVYNNWRKNINWTNDVESVTTYVEQGQSSPTPSPIIIPTPSVSPTTTPTPSPPTGPDCASETCKGIDCDSKNGSGNPWIPGTKIDGCATGSAISTPSSFSSPGNAFITWSSTGASKMDVACLGAVILPRGGWYKSGNDCYDANEYCKKNGTETGYELVLNESFFNSDKKTETCTFYPTNSSNGLAGTPFSFEIKIENTSYSPTPTSTSSPCGAAANNNYACDATQTSGKLCKLGDCYVNVSSPPTYCTGSIYFSGNQASWYCGTNKSCSASKLSSCSTPTPTPTPKPVVQQQRACERNNCEKNTCNYAYCDDGCDHRIKGTRVCDGS